MAAVQRLSSIISISGGITDRFRESVGQSDAQLGRLGRSIRTLQTEQVRLQRAIDEGDGNDEELAEYRRELERVTGEIREQQGEFNRLTQQTGRIDGMKRAFVGLAAAAATVGAAWGVIISNISSARQEFGKYQRQALESGLEIPELQALDFTLRLRGFDQGAGSQIISNFSSEFSLRLAKTIEDILPTYGRNLRAIGIDLVKEFEGLDDPFQRLLKVLEITNRVSREIGADQARVITESLAGAGIGRTISGIAINEYGQFLEDLRTAPTLIDNEVGSLTDLDASSVRLGVTIGTLRGSFVALLSEGLSPVLNILSRGADSVLNFTRENRGLAQTIVTVGVVSLIALTLAIGGAAAVLTLAMIPSLVVMIPLMLASAAAGWAMVAPFLPFIAIGVLVVAALVGIGVGVFYLQRRFGGLGNAVKTVFDFIVIQAASFAIQFLDTIQPVVDGINIIGKGLGAITGGRLGFEVDLSGVRSSIEDDASRRRANIVEREVAATEAREAASVQVQVDDRREDSDIPPFPPPDGGTPPSEPPRTQSVDINADINVFGVTDPEEVSRRVAADIGQEIADQALRF